MDLLTPSELIRHFGGVANAARKVGVSRQTIYKWLERGEIPERTEPFVRLVVAKHDK